MKITKYGHACVLVEESGARILIDPGSFNETPQVEELDAILVTHEHQDHCSVEQIQELLAKSPEAKVITHEAVGKVLAEAGVPHTLIEDGETISVKGVEVMSTGKEHAIIYEGLPRHRNTGFLIANKFYFPGDSFHVPGVPVEVLALPIGGPWMKPSEALYFAKVVKPTYAIPVHDALYSEDSRGFISSWLFSGILPNFGIEYRDMAPGSVEEF